MAGLLIIVVTVWMAVMLLVLAAGRRWSGVRVPRPKFPSKTDREVRNWERYIKQLRDLEDGDR